MIQLISSVENVSVSDEYDPSNGIDVVERGSVWLYGYCCFCADVTMGIPSVVKLIFMVTRIVLVSFSNESCSKMTYCLKKT